MVIQGYNKRLHILVTQMPTIGAFWQGLRASNKSSKLVQCSEASESPGYGDFLCDYEINIQSNANYTAHKSTPTRLPSLSPPLKAGHKGQ